MALDFLLSTRNPPTWKSIRTPYSVINERKDGNKYCCAKRSPLYNVYMMNSSEALTTAEGGSGSVAAICELTPQSFALHACCLWCGRAFKPRSTGGSVQRFCSTAHRQQFWIAARRWTMRAIEVGLPVGRLLKGVSYERARCLRRRFPRRDILRWREPIASSLKA